MLFAVVFILYFIYLFYLLLLLFFFFTKRGCYIMHCYSWSQHALGGVIKTWRPSLISLCFRAATTLLAPLVLSERIFKRLGFRFLSLEPQTKASLGYFLLKTTAGTCEMY